MNKGDILGHETMRLVQEVGSAAGDLKVGDRVVIPFQMSCGHCWMRDSQLYSRCGTTQVRPKDRSSTVRLLRALRLGAGRAGRVSPRGVDGFATLVLPIDDAPHAYEIFQKKQDGAVKIILKR